MSDFDAMAVQFCALIQSGRGVRCLGADGDEIIIRRGEAPLWSVEYDGEAHPADKVATALSDGPSGPAVRAVFYRRVGEAFVQSGEIILLASELRAVEALEGGEPLGARR